MPRQEKKRKSAPIESIWQTSNCSSASSDEECRTLYTQKEYNQLQTKIKNLHRILQQFSFIMINKVFNCYLL